MAQDSQTDGFMVVVIDKDTGKPRVSWDGESKQLGVAERTVAPPQAVGDHDDIDFKDKP
jgi:hypothetical protein